jgi:hypothetical protein
MRHWPQEICRPPGATAAESPTSRSIRFRQESMETVMKMQTHRELTDADLDRMSRLVEAATAGPWFSYVVGRDPDAIANRIELGWCNELGSFKSMETVGATAADQDFIASARQDLPRLLLEVRILRARLASLLDAEIGVRLRSMANTVEGSATVMSA